MKTTHHNLHPPTFTIGFARRRSARAGSIRKVHMIYVITFYSVRAEAVDPFVRSITWGASVARAPAPLLQH
ncbi:MAG: hypothetical protein ABSG51_00460 [Terracidiphilus sp.]|jgi:hypothetical protein